MRLNDYEDLPAVISHFAHAKHNLNLVTTGGAFRCDGCVQPGGGTWYRCETCNFDLHVCCARAPDTKGHPLFPGCTFVFLQETPAPAGGRHCDACGDDVRGFVNHCPERGLDLHPCCASLPERIDQDGHVFELRERASRRCCLCGQKGTRRDFWAYRSYYDGEAVYLHVACVMDRAWNSGGQAVQAITPMMDGVLQSLQQRTRRSSGFELFRKIVHVVVGVIIAVVFGNPMAMIAAIAGPGGLFR